MFSFDEKKRAELWRMVKFGITGVANTLVDFIVYTVLAVPLGVNVYLSQFCGYAAGMLNSYLVNRSWTFQSRDRFFSGQLFRFLVTNLAVLGVSMLLIKGFMAVGFGKILAKLGATCITLVLNFVISRLWVFRGQ